MADILKELLSKCLDGSNTLKTCSHIREHVQCAVEQLDDVAQYIIEINDEAHDLLKTEGLYEDFEKKITEQEDKFIEDVVVDPNQIFEDKHLWEIEIEKILDVDWIPDFENIESMLCNIAALISCYQQILEADDSLIIKLFPIISVLEDKVRMIMFSLGARTGQLDPIVNNVITSLKKSNTRSKSLTEKDWKELIETIQELDKKGALDKENSFNGVVKSINFEMMLKKRQHLIEWPPSDKTIGRCLNKVFNLTSKNFSQPLNLSTNFNH